MQISVASQAGLHCAMHCPTWQANPGEQIGVQPAPADSSTGLAVLAPELAGEASRRTATDAEMSIPAPSGVMPSAKP